MSNNIDIAYAVCIQAGVPVILWGPPGIGKTMRTQSIAKSLGKPLVEQVCSTWDPTDVGLPIVERRQDPELVERLKEDYSNLSHKEVVERLKELFESSHQCTGDQFARVPPKWAVDCDDNTILYLDEFSCTPPAVQASALKIVGERKCGDLALPKGLSIAMSANPADQAAGGWELAPPMANRMVHLECSLSANDWCEGMISGWPEMDVPKLPSGWRELVPSKIALVAAYIRRFGESHLLSVPEDEASQGRAWPSPRSWENLCYLLAAAESCGVGPAVINHLAKGTIGHPAISFLTFCEQLDLPDPETLIADPSLYEHFERGDKVHATLASVAAAVAANNTKKRWENGVQVMVRAADKGGTDIAAIAFQSLIKTGMPAGAEIDESVTRFFPMLNAAGSMENVG